MWVCNTEPAQALNQGPACMVKDEGDGDGEGTCQVPLQQLAYKHEHECIFSVRIHVCRRTDLGADEGEGDSDGE
jgi:hypothetical protein